jgi:hypothetical protein
MFYLNNGVQEHMIVDTKSEPPQTFLMANRKCFYLKKLQSGPAAGFFEYGRTLPPPAPCTRPSASVSNT